MRGESNHRSWRIGEVAAATGLSVRALRHYDGIGLVSPAARTAAGYREYSGEDVERLYRVLSLRRLGLGLEEIREVLRNGPEELPSMVQRQIERVDLEIRLARELRARLAALAEGLRRSPEPSFEQLTGVLEAMAMAMTNHYYTSEQREALERRAVALGPDQIHEAEASWGRLIEEVEAARTNGVAPASVEVQALAGRWRELIEQFTGGDPGIRASLQAMYEGEGVETASRGAVHAELMAYVQQAWDAAS